MKPDTLILPHLYEKCLALLFGTTQALSLKKQVTHLV